VAVIAYHHDAESEIAKYLVAHHAMPPEPKISRKSGTLKVENHLIGFTPSYPERPDAEMRREMRAMGCTSGVTAVCNATFQNAAEELVKIAKKNRIR